MDDRRFDALSRVLAHTQSRRATVRAAIAALASGGAVATIASADARIVCRRMQQSCSRDAQCCSGYCDKRTSLPRAQRNRCGCGADRVICPGSATCIDLSNDVNHCGACGNACPSDAMACIDGECLCPDDLTPCGDRCVDLNADFDHCGECDNQCPVDAMSCNDGVCDCPGTTEQCDDACVDLDIDPDNCGECGNVCADDRICHQGECACPGALDECDGVCVDLLSDEDHCGSCGNACADDQTCTNARCVCPAGTRVCDGACVDTRTDADHCSACGRACDAGLICEGSRCIDPRCSGHPTGKVYWDTDGVAYTGFLDSEGWTGVSCSSSDTCQSHPRCGVNPGNESGTCFCRDYICQNGLVVLDYSQALCADICETDCD